MKLIDLLVKHLGNNGGWPIGAEICAQDNDCEVVFYSAPGIHRGENNLVWTIPAGVESAVVKRRIFIKLADDMETAVIYRGQYEAALAASKVKEWDGEGLPPVGTECEAYDGAQWYPAVVVGHYDGFAFAWNYDHRITFTVNEIDSHNFRPIRTEAERKRDAATHAMASAPKPCGHAIYGICCEIYDAIAAGKIPGVKLEGS